MFGGSTPDEPGTVVLDSRIDAFALNQNSPERPDLFPGQTDRNHDKGLRLAERLRARLGPAATSASSRHSTISASAPFAQAPRIRGATPFTDRLTEGTQEGHFVLGQYLSAIQLDGDV